MGKYTDKVQRLFKQPAASTDLGHTTNPAPKSKKEEIPLSIGTPDKVDEAAQYVTDPTAGAADE